jgi:hypothetical protein
VVDIKAGVTFPCDACGKTIGVATGYAKWESVNMRACNECADDVVARASRIKSLPLVEFGKLVINGSNELIDVLRGKPVRVQVVKEGGDDGGI